MSYVHKFKIPSFEKLLYSSFSKSSFPLHWLVPSLWTNSSFRNHAQSLKNTTPALHCRDVASADTSHGIHPLQSDSSPLTFVSATTFPNPAETPTALPVIFPPLCSLNHAKLTCGRKRENTAVGELCLSCNCVASA